MYQHIKQREIVDLIHSELELKTKRHEVPTRNQICVYCSSSVIAKDLSNYGVLPRKTKTELKLPNIPYIKDFIRGFFEGDGTAGCYKNNCRRFGLVCNSETLLKEIQEILFYNNCKTILRKEKTYYRLLSSDTESIKNIYNFLYPAEDFCKYKENQLRKAWEYRGNQKH